MAAAHMVDEADRAQTLHRSAVVTLPERGERIRDRQRDLADSLRTGIERDNRSGDGALVLPSEYLGVVIERK